MWFQPDLWPLDFYLQAYFLSPFLLRKWIVLINFIRVLWFIWDPVLVLFNNYKDVVSGKILVFGNILGFPGINWAPKSTKTFNFRYVPFLLKPLILKDCLNAIFALWETTSGRKFSKLVPYLGEKGLGNFPKGWFHGCYITTKTFEHL